MMNQLHNNTVLDIENSLPRQGHVASDVFHAESDIAPK